MNTPRIEATTRAVADAPSPPLLRLIDLSVGFGAIRVVDQVSLAIPGGKTVALVGESGCGKSVTALAILRLLPLPAAQVDGGRILFADPRRADHGPVDLLGLAGSEMRRIRGNRIAMVFQEPMTSLHPVLSIGEQIVEVLELHRGLRGKRAWFEAAELLRRVRIADPDRRTRQYPHQLSGGMRQRVMIAMALAGEPALLIADEPTTALDVTVQREILDLLAAIQKQDGMGVLLITHDLGLVAQYADFVSVMYAGRIVEQAPATKLFGDPNHPYTQGLLECTPRMVQQKDRLTVIPGQVPDPSAPPTGCRFHPRCSLSARRAANGTRPSVGFPDTEAIRLRRCVQAYEGEPSGSPALRAVADDHFVACWEV